MSESFVTDVRRELVAAGRALIRLKVATSYVLAGTDGGAVLIVRRAVDRQPARITVSGTTEVFRLDLGGRAAGTRTASDDDAKWAAVRDHLTDLVIFVAGPDAKLDEMLGE